MHAGSFRMIACVGALAASGLACQSPDERGTGFRSSDLEQANGENLNGENLNGENLNGENLNGENLNGENLNGENLNGTSINGENLNGENLNGTFLSATTVSGTTLTGSDLIGTTFDGVTIGGQTVRLRIDSYAQGTGSNSDVYYYGLSWKDNNAGWRATCANGAPSIATMGRWNYGQGVAGGGAWTADWMFLTWSCVGSTITKCVEDGYKPWKFAGNTSLQPYHQACTRLLRADYCGNGQPYTVNGTLVDLYDGLNIQVDTDNWSFEAEWDQNGARCMTGKTRSPGPVPPCQSSLITSSCGRTGHFNNGTLLMSEIQ